ncbi:hypothetical protein JOC77_001045 [Peribacillus deserti]|uniref:Uncharacterized protein n=1 Tax=Peribacillus deserti TaxID=673318 RepID=A0ABS2QER5_9BACI|nr:hypothetical protein [Peribacillus deserti]MBM7691638.1 hypothetical protein [Peribacillus deserti]
MSNRTINKVWEKVQLIENESGKTFSQVIKPSISNYADVQQGKVYETVDKHEADLKSLNAKKRDSIKDDSDKQIQKAEDNSQPSVSEALGAGLVGAAIGGGINVSLMMYQKHKEGKSITEFDEQDWIELGIDLTKGAASGGIKGFSIYGLTNFTDISAPIASSFVSASSGISKISLAYKQGKIDLNEFLV